MLPGISLGKPAWLKAVRTGKERVKITGYPVKALRN